MGWLVPLTNTLFASPLGSEWTFSNATITRVTEPYYGPSGYSVRVVYGGSGSDPCVVYDVFDTIIFPGDVMSAGAWIWSENGGRIRCGWNEHDSGGVYLRTRANAFNVAAAGWSFITCDAVIGASARFAIPFYGRGTPSTTTCWVAAIGIPQIYPPAAGPALAHVQGHTRR